MQYSISGEIALSVRLDFAPAEFAWVSKGALMAHSSHLQWSLRVPGGALRRSLSGEGIALTYSGDESRGSICTAGGQRAGPPGNMGPRT